jgi:hypothetical protein
MGPGGRSSGSKLTTTAAPSPYSGGHRHHSRIDERDLVRRRSAIRTTGLVALTAVLTLAGGGIAYAWFVSTGTGSGSAIVGSSPSHAFVISADTPAGSVLPGGGPQAFDVSVANTTGQDAGVTIVSISFATSGNDVATDVGADIPGCLASWFSVTPSVTFDAVVPAHSSITASGRALPLPDITMSEAGVSQDACQGASIGVEFSTGP